jgi:hypothetical protein
LNHVGAEPAAPEKRHSRTREQAIDARGWRIHESVAGRWLCEQRLHFSTEFWVSFAGGLEKSRTLRGGS